MKVSVINKKKMTKSQEEVLERFIEFQESMIEKRKLASFPEFTAENYFSGQFTAGINHWFTDTVPYRDNFKNAGNVWSSAFCSDTEPAGSRNISNKDLP